LDCTLSYSPIANNRLFTPAVAVISTWFKRRRAAAIGIVASGSSVGAVIYPIALEKLIPQIGFGWSVRTIALIQIVTLAISNIVMKSRLPPRKVGPLIEPKAFLQPSYTIYTIGAFLAFWGLYTPFFYSTLYAVKVNAPSNLEPYVLPMMNVSSLRDSELTIGRIGIWTDNSEYGCRPFGADECAHSHRFRSGSVIVRLAWYLNLARFRGIYHVIRILFRNIGQFTGCLRCSPHRSP